MTPTDSRTVGPQLTSNKAHKVTMYDGMIMVVPLVPRARVPVPWSFVAPRVCAVVAFVRPRFGSAPVEWHLAIVVAYYVVGKRSRLGRGTIHQHAYVSIRCDCCARAASGQAAAAPPISVMKSRRFIRSPRQRVQGPLMEYRGRSPLQP